MVMAELTVSALYQNIQCRKLEEKESLGYSIVAFIASTLNLMCRSRTPGEHKCTARALLTIPEGKG